MGNGKVGKIENEENLKKNPAAAISRSFGTHLKSKTSHHPRRRQNRLTTRRNMDSISEPLRAKIGRDIVRRHEGNIDYKGSVKAWE